MSLLRIEPGVYRGVAFDFKHAPGMLFDLPFSVVFDTLMLPFDLYELATAPSEKGLRVLKELHGQPCPDDGYRIYGGFFFALGAEIASVERNGESFFLPISCDHDIAVLYRWVMGRAHPDLPCDASAIGSSRFEESLVRALNSTGMTRRQ